MQYWKSKQVDYDLSVSPALFHTGSEQLKRVTAGDTIWVVTVRPVGQLSLVGRMRVAEVTGREETERRFPGDLYSASFHAFASPSSEEPYNEMSLMDVVTRLTFISPTSTGLNIAGGGVNGNQLQTIRELTPESIEILERKWASGTSVVEFQQNVRNGSGFGNPETNRRVEKAAVAIVTTEYERNGWKVKSVEADKCGYDLYCSKSQFQEHVEVKGVQGVEPSFIITAGEFRQSECDPDFVICIVTSALPATPKIHRFKARDFAKSFDLIPLAFRAAFRNGDGL